MIPVLKWTGTKESVTQELLALCPGKFNQYFEPFFGSGALYFALDTEYGYANDHCAELIYLYRFIQEGNGKLVRCYRAMVEAWANIDAVFEEMREPLMDLLWRKREGVYADYLSFVSSVSRLVEKVSYAEVFSLPLSDADIFRMEMRHNIIQYILEMEGDKDLSEQTINGNLNTALKASVYSYLQELYNGVAVKDSVRSACLMFLMCYSAGTRFVFDDVGEFRVPYSGKRQNKVFQSDRLAVLESEEFRRKMEATHFSAMEFHRFFGHYPPKEGDFIYLDPPEIGLLGQCSDYTFTKEHHVRLADYLLHTCPSMWMMTVRRKKYIDELYAGKGLDIRPFNGDENVVVIRNYA